MKLSQGIRTVRTSLAALVLGLPSGCEQPSTPAAEKSAAEPISVEAVAVAEEQIQRTSQQPATVRPFFETEIRAQVTGYVTAVKADIGDPVTAGAELAQIDVPEMTEEYQIIEARIAHLKAVEKQTTAGVSLAVAGVQAAQADLESARSELQMYDAQLAATQAQFERVSDLVARRSLEERMLDEVRKSRDSDRARKQSAQSAIRAAQAQVEVAKAKQAAAEADAAAAIAETTIARKQLAKLKKLLEFTTVTAPFDGVVTARKINQGDLVSGNSQGGTASGPVLFVVSQIDPVRVHIPIPETDAAWVTKDDPVTLTFPSYPGEPIEANVTRLTQSLDHNTRTMLVEAVVENPERRLLPGMFGQGTVTLALTSRARVLPARAIRFSEDGRPFVYLLNQDDRVGIVDIEIGQDDGHTIEVLGPLLPGQRVVDAHLQRFADDQPVTVLNN